jgi:Fic family protein
MQIATYHADDSLQPRIVATEAEYARLTALGAFAGPAAEEVARELHRDFVYHSANIQGNHIARAEVARLLTVRPRMDQISADQREVINLSLGLDYIGMLALGEMPLTERLIRILHAVVMRGMPTGEEEAGSYRNDDLESLSYTVPPAADVIAEMGAFGRWLTLKPDAPEYEPRPVLRAAYAHTRLLTIHPFRNGNGRAARLLLNLVLLRAGYPAVAIDSGEKAAYLRGLGEATTYGNMTTILRLILDGLDRSLAAYATQAR